MIEESLGKIIADHLPIHKVAKEEGIGSVGICREVSPLISYVLASLEDGKICAMANPDMIHPSASMIKLLIGHAVVSMCREGKVSLQQRLSLKGNNMAEGGGALQELEEGHEFSLLELVRLMMVLSDNEATNMLVRFMGADMINEHALQMGLKHTAIRRVMMDFEAVKEGKENTTTAQDLLLLLEQVYKERHSTSLGAELWRILGRQQFRDKLPFFWGETPFYHKTGSLPSVEHDGGLYITSKGTYAMIVLSSRLPSNATGIQLLAAMGREMKRYVDGL